MGETLLGNSFALGPGAKGSNQAVAVARLGADVTFLSKLGREPFAEMAFKTWADAGVNPRVTQSDESYTGAAYIFVAGSRSRVDLDTCRSRPERPDPSQAFSCSA